MLASEQSVIIKQKRSKRNLNIETPTNNDLNNQSVQDPRIEPESNKNLINESSESAFPYLYTQVKNKEQLQSKQEDGPQIKCWHILFPQFNVKTINFGLIVFFSLYFIGVYLYHLTGPQPLLSCTLYELGAKFTPVIRHEGQFHRLIVSIPLFGSLLQAIICILTMLMFGFLVEDYVGKFKFLLTVSISGFFSNLLSGVAFPYYVSVGSSGLVFSIIALYISFLCFRSHQFGQQKNLVISLFILMIAANLISMIDTKAIDIAGIVGGFLSGGLFGFAFYEKNEKSPCYARLQKVALAILLVLNVTLIAVMFTLGVDEIDILELC